MDENLEKLKSQCDEVKECYGSYLVKKDGVCGVVRVEASGEKEEIVFDNVDEISGIATYPQKKYDLFQVQRNGKWGYINSEGKEIIPCKYEYLDVPSELVSDTINMIPGKHFDLDETSAVCEHFDDENFYRVLLHLLKNNLELAWESKNVKTIQQFLSDVKYCLVRYSDVIQKETDSEISKVGLSALQKFYHENIVEKERVE